MKSRVVLVLFLVQFLYTGIGHAQGYMRFGESSQPSTPQQQPQSQIRTQPQPQQQPQQQQQTQSRALQPQPVSASEEITDWRLPPLQTLIDMAIQNSPLIHLANATVQMGQYELKDVRRSWLNNISLVGDARYGSMFNYSRLAGMGDVTSTNDEMTTYGVGVSAYMPFSEIFDRKRSKQKANLVIDQSRMQREEAIIILTQVVINAYYDVLTAQRTLAINTEMSLAATMLHEQSRLDFHANRLTLEELTQTTESHLTALNNVEIEKFNLMRSIRILEVIVGVEIVR